jgi:hypothetical protein
LRIIATGVLLDEYPGDVPAHGHAADVVLVRSTAFVEFDAGDGPQRWEATPQGPFEVSTAESATSALLAITDKEPGDLLGELGIAGMKPARFEYRAAPRRIDVDPGLAGRLVLD